MPLFGLKSVSQFLVELNSVDLVNNLSSRDVWENTMAAAPKTQWNLLCFWCCCHTMPTIQWMNTWHTNIVNLAVLSRHCWYKYSYLVQNGTLLVLVLALQFGAEWYALCTKCNAGHPPSMLPSPCLPQLSWASPHCHNSPEVSLMLPWPVKSNMKVQHEQAGAGRADYPHYEQINELNVQLSSFPLLSLVCMESMDVSECI